MVADSRPIVLVSLISPYKVDKEHAKAIIGAERSNEIFVDTPLEVSEQRDPKGLYEKARKGLIPNFTRISAPCEVPEDSFFIVCYQAPTFYASSEIFTQLTQQLLES